MISGLIQIKEQLMAAITNTGNKTISQDGFTIIELLVVLLLIALLASVVTPIVSKTIIRAKEATLKENLFIMRKALDDYYTDNGHYPEQLEVLVNQRYLRFIPIDPLTENTEWSLTYTETNVTAQGIIDIHSQSSRQAKDGSNYNDW